nr:hypothetical protein [Tanacetum cinerariifolium]
ELLRNILQSADRCRILVVVLGLQEDGCLWCSGAPYPLSPHVPNPHQDTVGFEFGQNRKNRYCGPSVDTGNFHGIPHNKRKLLLTIITIM